MTTAEYGVVGGGILGAAVAWGLSRLGHDVILLDEGDRAFRASRGNFGLIWVQGKGDGMANYARWTRHSAALWPELAAQLQEQTGIDLELRQPGGLDFCLDDDECEQATRRLTRIKDALAGDYPFEFIARSQLIDMVPQIGPDVVGATFCQEDGHVNPLYLLRALYDGFIRQGGRVINNSKVRFITPTAAGFNIEGSRTHVVNKVVLAAGLGNRDLGPQLDLSVPVQPNRGQILVSERTQPFLEYPSVQIRQVGEGAIQIGDSKEDVGFDDGTTPEIVGKIAQRAVRVYPILGDLRMVRTWAALRVMTPDGFPIYQQSTTTPGAFVVTCHSGVTLAAAHALSLSRWISGHPAPVPVETFSGDRF